MQSSGGSAVATILYLIIVVACIAGLWKMFIKAGKPGWAAIVPIYNLIVLIQIAGKPVWWIILLIIPIVSLVILVILFLEIVKKFGQPAWHVVLMILFSFIYIPYLGFSDVKYQG